MNGRERLSYLDAADVLGMLRLREQHLCQCIHDADLMRTEVRGELASVQFPGLSVLLIEDFLACSCKSGWQRDIEELFELARRGLRPGDVQGTSEPVRAVANLNWRGGGNGLGGDFGGSLLDRNATSTCEGSRACVGGKGSLDLIHETSLGHGESIAVEGDKSWKGWKGWKGLKDGKNGKPFDFC
jgi:hypothetical protein